MHKNGTENNTNYMYSGNNVSLTKLGVFQTCTFRSAHKSVMAIYFQNH